MRYEGVDWLLSLLHLIINSPMVSYVGAAYISEIMVMKMGMNPCLNCSNLTQNRVWEYGLLLHILSTQVLTFSFIDSDINS